MSPTRRGVKSLRSSAIVEVDSRDALEIVTTENTDSDRKLKVGKQTLLRYTYTCGEVSHFDSPNLLKFVGDITLVAHNVTQQHL